MNSSVSNEFKIIMQSELKFLHFVITLVLMTGLSIGVLVLEIIFCWLYYPSFWSSSYSNVSSSIFLFGICTIDLILMILVLVILNKKAKKRNRLEYCKSYFIVGVILFLLYLVFISLPIGTN